MKGVTQRRLKLRSLATLLPHHTFHLSMLDAFHQLYRHQYHFQKQSKWKKTRVVHCSHFKPISNPAQSHSIGWNIWSTEKGASHAGWLSSPGTGLGFPPKDYAFHRLKTIFLWAMGNGNELENKTGRDFSLFSEEMVLKSRLILGFNTLKCLSVCLSWAECVHWRRDWLISSEKPQKSILAETGRRRMLPLGYSCRGEVLFLT